MVGILTCHFRLYAGWLAESLQRAFLPSVPSGQPHRVDIFTVYSSMRAPVMWQTCLQRSEHPTALLTHLEQLKAENCSQSQQWCLSVLWVEPSFCKFNVGLAR